MDTLPDPKSLLETLDWFGVSSDSTHEEQQQRRFLILMALLMSCGGVLWGTLCLVFGFYSAAIVPFGYTVLTALNLTYFRWSSDFTSVRFIQVLISLLLPVIFQIMLGGFVRSGAVMLWSMLALGGSLTFSSLRLSLQWLVLFVVSVVVCGYYDEFARAQFATSLDPNLSTLFFVINISVITSIFFVLIVILINAFHRAQRELHASNRQVHALAEGLEEEVTERTLALRESLGQTQAIVSNLAEGLVAVDLEQNITATNPALRALFGSSIKTSGNASLTYDMLPEALALLLRQSIAQEQNCQRDFRVQDGRHITATASPVMLQHHDGQRQLVGSVVLARDVSTERKLVEIQEQLELAERMSALGTLAAGIAHEINNPLTYVLSNLEMLREDLQPTDSGELDLESLGELSQEALEGVNRISRVVQELRSFMRAQTVELSEVDLHAALQSALNLAQHELQSVTRVEITADDQLPTALADEQRIVQVFVNLLVNAAQAFHTPDPTHNCIWVTLTSLPSSSQDIEGGILQVTLRDNASGMSPEVSRRIFDPFFTTKTASGTGLGLAICHRMMNDLSGTISVSSEEGVGTTFTLTIPQYSEETFDIPLEHTDHTVDLHGIHDVLLIDDDPAIGQVVRRILGAERVRVFENGWDALQAIPARPPQVIICDVMMPDISGLEVYTALKSLGLTSRTFLITGGVTSMELEDFIHKEAPTILYKPFSPKELRVQVRQVIAQNMTP